MNTINQKEKFEIFLNEYSCGNKSTIPTGNYYLLSLEKTEELYLNLKTDFEYVYKTPDDGIIYYAQILKSDINVMCDGINISNKKIQYN